MRWNLPDNKLKLKRIIAARDILTKTKNVIGTPSEISWLRHIYDNPQRIIDIDEAR